MTAIHTGHEEWKTEIRKRTNGDGGGEIEEQPATTELAECSLSGESERGHLHCGSGPRKGGSDFAAHQRGSTSPFVSMTKSNTS